jgi:hypothetical protein
MRQQLAAYILIGRSLGICDSRVAIVECVKVCTIQLGVW